MSNEQTDPFEGLLKKLQEDNGWPQLYLFKFIIPNDNQRLAKAEALFGEEAQVSISKSRGGKYLSLSARELMISPEDVVRRYRKAVEIEGLIAL